MLARWREEGAEGGEVREEKQAQVEVPTAARMPSVERIIECTFSSLPAPFALRSISRCGRRMQLSR